MALALLSLSACGGAGTPAAERAEQAAAKTSAARTAKFTVQAAATAGGRTISEIGQGAVDFTRDAVDVKFARSAQPSGNQRDQQTIIVGNDSWTSTPASVIAKLPAAKPFIHSTRAQRNANPLAQLTQPDDPTRALDALTGIDPATVKRVGKESVRGTDTTRLQAQVDLNRVGSSDPAAKAQADALQQLMRTNVMPVELWVDSDGRARRVRTTLQHIAVTPAATSPTTGTAPPQLLVDLVITNEFFDFGAPVVINPPPADQVTDVSQIPA
jgi:hypothetical protein